MNNKGNHNMIEITIGAFITVAILYMAASAFIAVFRALAWTRRKCAERRYMAASPLNKTLYGNEPAEPFGLAKHFGADMGSGESQEVHYIYGAGGGGGAEEVIVLDNGDVHRVKIGEKG